MKIIKTWNINPERKRENKQRSYSLIGTSAYIFIGFLVPMIEAVSSIRIATLIAITNSLTYNKALYASGTILGKGIYEN